MTAPDSQLFNLLSVSRPVAILDETDDDCVICKLDKGVSRGAVICVEGEEQWGENTALRSSSADDAGVGCEFSQPHIAAACLSGSCPANKPALALYGPT